jgi:hypothetical protein
MKRFHALPKKCQYMDLNDSNIHYYLRCEVFTAVTVKNAVFWDVTLCYCLKN